MSPKFTAWEKLLVAAYRDTGVRLTPDDVADLIYGDDAIQKAACQQIEECHPRLAKNMAKKGLFSHLEHLEVSDARNT